MFSYKIGNKVKTCPHVCICLQLQPVLELFDIALRLFLESKSLVFNKQVTRYFACQDKLQSVQPSSSKYENINFNPRTSMLTESFSRYLSLKSPI